MTDIPQFSEEQKKYFQEQLAAQSGKTLNLSPELLTFEQRATLAHDTGDLRALDDIKVRSAFLAKYGTKMYGDLHLKFTRAEREKKAAAERERLLSQSKARRSRI